jgi:hypothetical protein
VWTDKLVAMGSALSVSKSFEVGLSIADQRETERLTTAGFWMTAAVRLTVGWEGQTNLQAHPVRRNLNASGANP